MNFDQAFRRNIVVAVISTYFATGCSANSSPSSPITGPTACAPHDVLDGPVATLEYPQPNATSVPVNFATLVYADASPVAIQLLDGGVVIATKPTALPSPLPSPIATPASGMSYFAVSVPPLVAATTYTVEGDADDLSGCAGQRTIFEEAGGFATQ